MTDETARWQTDPQLSGSARIDLACDDFENAWKENRRPSIEGYLVQLPADQRDTVFRELLTVELSYRQRHNDPPSRHEYLVRFPDYATQIDELFKNVVTPVQLGDYELLDKLGKGGMGVVHKARHRMLDRIVAVKVLPENYTDDDQTLSRFRREMKLIARLDHVNIVRAHDAREENGVHYLVMEYVDGVNLHELVTHLGPLPIAAACEIIRQVALGLHHAFEHGLVHRDMKPSNMMLSRTGEVKILDLGLARFSAEHQQTRQLTEQGFAMGTVDYMAPEQWEDSSAVDIRADIYSLGCTLFFLLTGSAPYCDPPYNSARKKLMAHAAARIPSLSERLGDVPRQLDEMMQWILAKEPEDRPATPAEMADALGPWADPAALGEVVHEEFSAEGVVRPANRGQQETTPPGRKSPRTPRGATPTRKSSRWMRTTNRRNQSDTSWYRRPALILPLAAVLLGLVGLVVFSNMEQRGLLDEATKQRLQMDVVAAPGPYGDWWFEEAPWLMPSLRARLLRRIDQSQDLIGEENLYHLASTSTASDVDTYEASLRNIARTLIPKNRERMATDIEADFLLGDGMANLPEEDFRDRLDKLQRKLAAIKSPSAVQLHERAVLLHYLGQWLAADAIYQEALEAYGRSDPPLDSLATLCQADRAMLAFHRSDYTSAEQQFRALRQLPQQQIGPALRLHAWCYEIDSLRKQGEFAQAHRSFDLADEFFSKQHEANLASQHPLRAYLLERDAWNELDWGHLTAAKDRFEEANRIRMRGGQIDPLNEGNWGAYAFNLQGQAMAMHFLGDEDTAEKFNVIVRLLNDHSNPKNAGAELAWEERLQLRERLPNTYERMADEYIYGSRPDLARAQKALEESLKYARALSFDQTRKWPHVNRIRYKLAIVLTLQAEDDDGKVAEARSLLEEGRGLEERMSGDESLPDAIVVLYAADKRLASDLLDLKCGDEARRRAAQDRLLAMIREASAEDAESVTRANVEPLLLAIEQLAQSPGLPPEVPLELRDCFETITADLRHSEQDRETIQQNYLSRYSRAIEAAIASGDAPEAPISPEAATTGEAPVDGE